MGLVEFVSISCSRLMGMCVLIDRDRMLQIRSNSIKATYERPFASRRPHLLQSASSITKHAIIPKIKRKLLLNQQLLSEYVSLWHAQLLSCLLFLSPCFINIVMSSTN